MPLAGKPISAYRYRTPPLAWQSRAITKPPLAQFVLLSMLLHALLISLFGAPSGGSREGRALWVALDVVLVGNEPAAGPALNLVSPLATKRPRIRRNPFKPKITAPPPPPPRPAPQPPE